MRTSRLCTRLSSTSAFHLHLQDLEVAPDLLSYFSQTVPLLAKDPSLLTVSAWNDNGFEWSAADPATVYRTEVGAARCCECLFRALANSLSCLAVFWRAGLGAVAQAVV